MSNAEIIGSTNLIILLEDEIFADFFNTFLSLPIAKYKGLLTWLEKYRLPYFCKANLCFHYILCQEFISFIKSPEGGEELVDFWILVEKILSIDEMDLEVRDHYLSLLFVLKATHLQESSRVVTLCNMNIKALLNLSIWHPNQSTTRREILSHMQKVALFKLQSYWLPNFYTHAKTAMAQEESCRALMQEYETRLCSICCTHEGGLPLNMNIRKAHQPQKKYSSRKIKRKMWHFTERGSWSLEMEAHPDTNTVPPQELDSQDKVVLQKPFLKEASSKDRIISSPEEDVLYARKSNVKKKAKSHLHMEGLFETAFSTRLRTVTPIINYSSLVTIKKAVKQNLSLGYTHWALCADACAGSPFRDHLKKLNLKVEVQLLDLWQDLHHFLSVLMRNRKTGKAIFRHMLGNRICELYLNEQIGPRLPLKSQTIEGLKEMLPSGDVNPWIPRTQKEICKTQSRIISTKWHKKESIGKEDIILLYKRFEESLELSQGLANMEEMESMQWQKIATEDLKQGGSLRVERKSPVFLTEQMLQCNAPIIKEVSLMHHVSTTTLLMLQGYVMRSLEEKWFKDYQELFPPHPLEKEAEIPIASPKKPSKTAVYLHKSQKRGWLKMISFIRSFCNYRRFMSHPHKRQELEDYLHLEVHSKENFSTAPNTSGRPMPNPSVRSTDHENGDVVLMKRRVFGNRIIIINYAVNDFYFFSEMEKFNDLVSSARVLQVNRAYNENDVILMKSKIGIILKLYLHADVPPRLRVNISDAQKDAILTAISDGHLDRSIFHGAIMSVFPIIMYFWKRFCAWKAIRSYLQYMGKKFKDVIISPKPVYKYPPWSGDTHPCPYPIPHKQAPHLLPGVQTRVLQTSAHLWLTPQMGQGSRKGLQLTEAAEGMRQNSSSQNSGKKLRQDARKRMEKSPVTGTEVPGMSLVQKNRNQNVEPEKMSGQQQGDR
ncbi:hypothetical protein JEQ12_003929 [Ovis aries]|uniref:Regulator of G-protein signaling protein-like n=1 Tax=Ovis aries TaxID=9940 RepID=A0A836A783_SHEEP|nr:hypothetical protein JEQ12_003929 [Ovis aries]